MWTYMQQAEVDEKKKKVMTEQNSYLMQCHNV